MAVDWSKVGTQAARAQQSHEDKKTQFIAVNGEAMGRIIDANPNATELEIIQLAASTKPGGMQAIYETAALALGIDTSSTSSEDDEPKLRGYLPAFEHDGTPLGTGFKSEDEARAAGFEVWLDPAGAMKGWRKPAPAALTASTPKVKIVDKKGSPKGEIDLTDYTANTAKYVVVESSPEGTPLKVREVRVIGR